MEKIITYLIFGFPGLILLIGGIKGLIKKNGIKTVSEIIDLRLCADNDRESRVTTTYPVVEFYDTDGNKIVKELSEGNGRYMKGQRLNIIYLKRNDNYEIITNSKLFLIRFPLGMAIIGAIILSTIFFIIITK
ncbi:hypothetical protein [Pseudofulvibacter geojedonensis]|uniref:DUF3592 domain-containing protein n=1 Tax=Pseudofulvibacter geojedonensis TaxID=1123758 RepID=A0ABW3I3U3_9FLAO